MSSRVLISFFLSALLAGCATSPSGNSTRVSRGQIVPDRRLHGRIATVNTQGQFVVVDFNVGGIPPLPSRMNVYRKNEIVAVINLAGPINDNLVAADIVSGEPTVGDDAIWDREKPGAKQAVNP